MAPVEWVPRKLLLEISAMPKAKTRPAGERRDGAHFARYTLIGFFTVAPLWVTWLVLDFLLNILANAGTPLLLGAARIVTPFSATPADWLRDSSFQKLIAVIVTLALFHGIGVLASFVLGWRLIELFEAMLARLPLEIICVAAKRFLQTLRQPPLGGQRVVLISFPAAGIRFFKEDGDDGK